MSTDRHEVWSNDAVAGHSLNREPLLSAVLDSLTEGVVACDAQGLNLYFNRATVTFHGRNSSDVPKSSWAEEFSLHRADGTRMSEADVPLARALGGEKFRDVVMVIAPPNTAARTVLCTGGSINDADGDPAGAVVVMRDISDQIEGERHKSDAARERELNRAKDEFLATLAHELRTPLTSILGWTQMLHLREQEAARAVAAIEQSTRMQAQLIEDLSDITRIASGKFLLKMETLPIAEIVGAAVTAVRPTAEFKHVEILISPHLGPALVKGDALRLQQVFWNLLTNAIKFTPTGGQVEVRVAGDESSIVVDVIDNGAGVTAEYLPLMFNRYSQGDAGRAFGSGLGIGLSIARSIVELHDGSITAHSDGQGRGATFRVTLPLASL